jgi:hypothetical protein
LAAKGEFDPIQEHLAKALDKKVDWVGDHDLYAMLVDGAAQNLDAEAIAKFAPLAEETARRTDHKLYLSLTHRAWGVLHRLSGEFDEAESRLTASRALCERLGARWQLGRTLVELGRLSIARGEVDDGRQHLEGAHALFDELGATPEIVRVRQELASLA